jgi:hypothetical protein
MGPISSEHRPQRRPFHSQLRCDLRRGEGDGLDVQPVEHDGNSGQKQHHDLHASQGRAIHHFGHIDCCHLLPLY